MGCRGSLRIAPLPHPYPRERADLRLVVQTKPLDALSLTYVPEYCGLRFSIRAASASRASFFALRPYSR